MMRDPALRLCSCSKTLQKRHYHDIGMKHQVMVKSSMCELHVMLRGNLKLLPLEAATGTDLMGVLLSVHNMQQRATPSCMHAACHSGWLTELHSCSFPTQD